MEIRRPGADFRWATVRADGFELDYAEAGPRDSARTLVSFPGSAGIEMSTAKDRLARHVRVLEINPPGWGGRPSPERPMTNVELAAVLAGAIRSLVDDPFALLGTSAGGATALHVAAVLAERILGVILEGSIAPTVPSDHRGPLPRTSGSDSDAPLEDMPLPRPHPRKPWATPAYFHERRRNQLSLFRWFLPDYMPVEQMSQICERRIPVLALLGDGDELIKPSQAGTLSRVMPHARFRLLEGGLHDLQNTQPEAFVRETLTFLEEQ